MKNFKSILVINLIFVLTNFSQPVFGQGKNSGDLNYPELMVTPRASERLSIESQKEIKMKGYWYKQHAPLQLSALMTLLSSFQLSSNKPFYPSDQTNENSNTEDAIKVGQMIGVGWLALTSYMAFNYKPYKRGYKEIKRLPKSTKKQKLTRERIAEEHINNAASVGKKMAWGSFVSNFLASAYMTSASKGDASIFSGLSVIASAAPLLFDYNWISISDSHKEYKKKIYGPIAKTGIILEPSTNKPLLGLVFNYSF